MDVIVSARWPGFGPLGRWRRVSFSYKLVERWCGEWQYFSFFSFFLFLFPF